MREGLDGMKFALNHSHRFNAPYFAFGVSFLLFGLMVFLEFVNFLLVLNTDNLNDLIQNVTALLIITEADIILYNTLPNEVLKDIVELETFKAVCLQIARTTSSGMIEFKEENEPMTDDALFRWE